MMEIYNSPAPLPPPQPLKRLFSASTPEAQRVRQYIRQYNSVPAFRSLGAQVDDNFNRGGDGPPVSEIHGELHHTNISSLLPPMYDLSMPSCTSLATYLPHATSAVAPN